MKNLFVLPTEKPSRLFKIVNVFVFDVNGIKYTEHYKQLHKYINQHIYITSDEEIKKGDWYVNTFDKRIGKNNIINHSYHKKIILTTDKDLIKDGVQSIDDDFLEWFVKNPSCQEVEVRKIEDEIISPKNPKIRFNALQDPPSFISAESLNNMILTYKYKIIIPKEEPKQEQSAVEWYSDKLLEILGDNVNLFTKEQTLANHYALKQAKEMEKQQELMHNKMLEILKIISNGFDDSKKHLIIKKAKELIK